MEAWAEIGNGHDPAQKRSDLANAITVKEFAQKYLEDQVKIRTSPRTASDYTSMLHNHVLPVLGHMRLEDVTRADVEKLHHSMNSTKARANRTIAVVKAMFNKAGDWGVISYSDNPAIRLKLFKENPRIRQFQVKERQKIGSATYKQEVVVIRSVLKRTNVARSTLWTSRPNLFPIFEFPPNGRARAGWVWRRKSCACGGKSKRCQTRYVLPRTCRQENSGGGKPQQTDWANHRKPQGRRVVGKKNL